MALRKWEREMFAAWRPPTKEEAARMVREAEKAAESPDPPMLRGWAEIAEWLQVDERNLRKAHAELPALRRVIRKAGRCYVADRGELLNVVADLYDRQAGGEGRSLAAKRVPRVGGRFSMKAK
jgi:hypothetical protein